MRLHTLRTSNIYLLNELKTRLCCYLSVNNKKQKNNKNILNMLVELALSWYSSAWRVSSH